MLLIFFFGFVNDVDVWYDDRGGLLMVLICCLEIMYVEWWVMWGSVRISGGGIMCCIIVFWGFLLWYRLLRFFNGLWGFI